MDAQLQKIYQHYSFVKPIVDNEIFEKFFNTKNKTLVIASPHLLALAKRFDIQADYLKCGQENQKIVEKYDSVDNQYDTIMMDLEDKTPSHKNQNMRDPSYMCYLRDGFDKYLKDGGKMIVKLPLVSIRYLCEKNKKNVPYYLRMNVTEIFINEEDNYIIAKIAKEMYNGKTQISYFDSERVIVQNIHEELISPSSCDHLLNLISQYKKTANDNLFESYQRIVGTSGKKCKHLDLKKEINDRGLVVYTNTNKVRFKPLEDLNATSSCVIYTFEDKKSRDYYYNILNKKQVVNIIKRLSYHNTLPQYMIPLIFHPATIEYAKSI
jgi:hypothetical protein